LKSGAIQYSLIQHVKYILRIQHERELVVFKVKVTLSIKSKVSNESDYNANGALSEYYTVYATFDVITKNFSYYLYSICGCYDGYHVCSHLLGFMIFIRCAQRYDKNQIVFESCMPRNPLVVQNSTTLIKNVTCSENTVIRSKRKVDCISK